MRYVIAFFMAWGNFLTLPCPYKRWDGKLKNLMMVFVPLVGVIIGVLWVMIIWTLRVLDMKYGLPDSVVALICTFYIFAIWLIIYFFRTISRVGAAGSIFLLLSIICIIVSLIVIWNFINNPILRAFLIILGIGGVILGVSSSQA